MGSRRLGLRPGLEHDHVSSPPKLPEAGHDGLCPEAQMGAAKAKAGHVR